MRRTEPILRQQQDACSCWVCRDKKFRETRKTDKQKAMFEELNQGINDNDIIFDLQMEATYSCYMDGYESL